MLTSFHARVMNEADLAAESGEEGPQVERLMRGVELDGSGDRTRTVIVRDASEESGTGKNKAPLEGRAGPKLQT